MEIPVGFAGSVHIKVVGTGGAGDQSLGGHGGENTPAPPPEPDAPASDIVVSKNAGDAIPFHFAYRAPTSFKAADGSSVSWVAELHHDGVDGAFLVKAGSNAGVPIYSMMTVQSADVGGKRPYAGYGVAALGGTAQGAALVFTTDKSLTLSATGKAAADTTGGVLDASIGAGKATRKTDGSWLFDLTVSTPSTASDRHVVLIPMVVSSLGTTSSSTPFSDWVSARAASVKIAVGASKSVSLSVKGPSECNYYAFIVETTSANALSATAATIRSVAFKVAKPA